MDEHWVSQHGYTQPNASVYPWMWLWDSCFHSIIYAALRDERALIEASSIFRWQTSSGMVPHMGYQLDEEYGKRAWGGHGGSTITQPPMYGHMIRVLHECGVAVSALVDRAEAGIRFLLDHRRLTSGLVGVLHPWETGMDDSPRWSAWGQDPLNPELWRARKDAFVTSLVLDRTGASVANPLFSVAPASFNALVAFNALELSAVTGDVPLRRDARELAEILDSTFDADLATWLDTGADGAVSSSIRTLDALLPALVTSRRERVRSSLRLTVDPRAFGAAFGPAGVDQREESFDPDAYWRGPAWPQLTYLMGVAAERSGHRTIRRALVRSAVRGAFSSNFSEYHNPLTGEGRGASPQSWSTLPVTMIRPPPSVTELPVGRLVGRRPKRKGLLQHAALDEI